jgi:uncharacterized surface protein with fasciclin (FAS1) repeats
MTKGYRWYAGALTIALSIGAVCLAEVITPARPLAPGPAGGHCAEPACHTRLIAAFRASELVAQLRGKGPFTVFAPDDGAFERLPGATDDWGGDLPPAAVDKAALRNFLSYHLVPGHLNGADLRRLIDQGHGSASLQTVAGGRLILGRTASNTITIEDENGDLARIDGRDLGQSRSGIFSIDRVLRRKPAI